MPNDVEYFKVSTKFFGLRQQLTRQSAMYYAAKSISDLEEHLRELDIVKGGAVNFKGLDIKDITEGEAKTAPKYNEFVNKGYMLWEDGTRYLGAYIKGDE